MQTLFRAGYFEVSFDSKQDDPLVAKVVTSMTPGRLLNLSEMQDLAAAINACVDAMQTEQFSRDYDKEQSLFYEVIEQGDDGKLHPVKYRIVNGEKVSSNNAI